MGHKNEDDRLKEMSSKIDALLQRFSDASPPGEPLEMPMGVNDCMKFLSELEGRPVTRAAVYNRVNKGKLPYWKKGKILLFSKREILKCYLTSKDED